MENGYENFVDTLRQSLLKETSYEEEMICYKKAEEYPIAIGNFLMLSPSFPPLHTVHETFASYGVPSYPNRFISYFPVIVWYP